MIKTITTSILAITIASVALSGCGSGQSRSTATAKASASVPADVTKATHELDEVIVGLKGIRDSSDDADLKKLYGGLKSNAGELHDALGDVASSSASAVSAGQDQIKEWHQQADGFTDPDLRNSSNKRESDLRQAVDALAVSNAQCTKISEAYESQLSQTLSALDLDLSRAGVKSVEPVVAKLVGGGSDLRSALSDVSEKSAAVNAVIHR
ncbi:MAG: hypothetical protein H0V44_10730 [Planctomycetes bacterium]|nr:hypothetical protein [Planctomycetota bacterium]